MRWRTGDKEIKKSRFLHSIPGIVCAEQPERLRNSHTLLPLHETPTGRNNQSMRVSKPFSYQEIQRIKEDLGDYLVDPHFSDILRASPAWGFGFTSWTLPHPYTIGLSMGVSNPFDNKTCVHLEDQTCHHWDRKNDSEISCPSSFTQKLSWEVWRLLGIGSLSSGRIGLKTFQKMNKCVFVVRSWWPGKSNNIFAKKEYIHNLWSLLIFPSLYVIYF